MVIQLLSNGSTTQQFVGIFLAMIGFAIGLGSVTVIDVLGFLGRSSTYWSQLAVHVHRVTKSLIWIGIALNILGLLIYYGNFAFPVWGIIQLLIALVLVGNGYYLTTKISPLLLQRIREGKSNELLPQELQQKILYNFIASFSCWWLNVLLFSLFIASN